MYKKFIGVASAMALSTVPVMASAATVSNPASALSISSSVRAGGHTTNKSKAAGAGVVFGVLIVAGVAAIIAVAATKDDNSASN